MPRRKESSVLNQPGQIKILDFHRFSGWSRRGTVYRIGLRIPQFDFPTLPGMDFKPKVISSARRLDNKAWSFFASCAGYSDVAVKDGTIFVYGNGENDLAERVSYWLKCKKWRVVLL